MKLVLFSAALFVSASAFAQAPNGQALYDKSCASCHQQPAADSRAPNREALRQFSPEMIVTALTTGRMTQQGYALSEAERKAVAELLAGRPVGSPTPIPVWGRCWRRS